MRVITGRYLSAVISRCACGLRHSLQWRRDCLRRVSGLSVWCWCHLDVSWYVLGSMGCGCCRRRGLHFGVHARCCGVRWCLCARRHVHGIITMRVCALMVACSLALLLTLALRHSLEL